MKLHAQLIIVHRRQISQTQVQLISLAKVPITESCSQLTYHQY